MVMLARASGVVRYPSRFQLVLAANPCPCAAAKDSDCVCPAGVRRRYLGRMSGPLLDRVDIRIDLPPLAPIALLARGEDPESSATVRARVVSARQRSRERWKGSGWETNAEVPGSVIRRTWTPRGQDSRLLDHAVRSGRLTGRGYERVLRLALTSADLAGHQWPERSDIATALVLRCGEAAA